MCGVGREMGDIGQPGGSRLVHIRGGAAPAPTPTSPWMRCRRQHSLDAPGRIRTWRARRGRGRAAPTARERDQTPSAWIFTPSRTAQRCRSRRQPVRPMTNSGSKRRQRKPQNAGRTSNIASGIRGLSIRRSLSSSYVVVEVPRQPVTVSAWMVSLHAMARPQPDRASDRHVTTLCAPDQPEEADLGRTRRTRR